MSVFLGGSLFAPFFANLNNNNKKKHSVDITLENSIPSGYFS